MFSRVFGFGIAFVAFLVLGLVIGYAIRPSVGVEIYDPAACTARPSKLQTDVHHPVLDEIAASDSQFASELADMRDMVPLVQAGPFHISLNPTTGSYLIYNTAERQIVAQQLTEGEETTLSLHGKGEQVMCALTYEKNTGRLIRSMFMFNGKDRNSDLPKYTYLDKDGDGRLDIKVDREAGVRYEQQELQWIALDRVSDGTREDQPSDSAEEKQQPDSTDKPE